MAAKEFDENQKKAINSKINSVVSAGAGSGKTTVLAERFLNLIESSAKTHDRINADEILTLTFTKKATVEMSSRIYKVLKARAPEQAELFYKANIRTLDSYCNSIARTGAHFYGVSPDFTQDDKKIRDFMSLKAVPFILKHRDNEAIKELVTTKDYALIADELFVTPILNESTVAEPIDFKKALDRQIQEIIITANAKIKEINKTLSLLNSAYYAYDGKKTKTFTDFEEALKTEVPAISCLSKEETENGNFEVLRLYVQALSIITKKVPSGSAGDIVKEYIYKIREGIPVIASIVNFIAGIRMTKMLIPLLEEFQEIVSNFKRTSGFLTYRDAPSLALRILIDHPEIRQIEKEKFKAIMIDEFQDNNSMQRDMLFLLAEKLERREKSIPAVEELCPNKLFFVGDEKQSIYLFRGADVSVFRALAKDFEKGNLSMNTNYRSDSALIAGFNTIFGGVPYPASKNAHTAPKAAFYTEKDMEKTQIPAFEAVYHEVSLPKNKAEEAEAEASSITSDEEKESAIFKPHIHFAFFDSTQDIPKGYLTNKESEAEWIAEKILDLKENGINGKKYDFKDIAVLFKTYTNQTLYEKTFLSHGIPYNTEVVKGFFSDGPVNDIVSMLRLCVYENDTVSYAQLLCSPFVNLSFEEANAVILQKQKPFELSDETVLCEEGLRNFQWAGDFFKKIMEDSKKLPVTKLISKIWYESGYRYETLWNTRVQMYAKFYDMLFELAHKAEQDNLSLADFTDEVLTYKSSDKKLEDINVPIEQEDGVHILSIYKSKGLEYPVVFIVNTNSTLKPDSNSSPVYCSKEFGITINTPPVDGMDAPNYFFAKAKAEESQKESAELRRIAYVALTRAKNEIFITNNNYKKDENAEEKFMPGGTSLVKSIFNILEPAVNFYKSEENMFGSPFDFTNIEAFPRGRIVTDEKRANTFESKEKLIGKIEKDELYNKAKVITEDELESKYILPSHLHAADEESGRRIISEYRADSAFKRLTEIIISTIPESEKDLEDAEPRFSFADFGVMAHAYMESAVTNGEVHFSNSILAGLNSESQIEELKEICTDMQKKFIESDLGKRAIKSKFHKAEYSFKSRTDDGQKIIKGTIDLIFQEEDGSYTIVDYKTNATIEPSIYYGQLSCYKKAVAQMLGQKIEQIKCVLYYLRYGKEIDISRETNLI